MSLLRDEISLNVDWHLVEDAADTGVEAQWFLPEQQPSGSTVHVPYHPKSVASPPTHDRNAPPRPHWIFHHFTLDAQTFQERHCALFFEGFSTPATVWLNGRRLGRYTSSLLPFSIPVHAHLQAPDNCLALRLDAPPQAIGNIALRCMPRQHIELAQLHPDIRRKRVVVRVQKNIDAPVRLSIMNTAHSMVGAEDELVLDFDEFALWRPHKPVLYRMKIELLEHDDTRTAKILDCCHIDFGMREFTVKDQRFYLNNRPFYLKVMRGSGSPPLTMNQQEAERLAQCAKHAGFNALYAETPFPQTLLQAADQLGVLVMLHTPGLYDKTAADAETEIDSISALPEAAHDFLRLHVNRPALAAWLMPTSSLPQLQAVPGAEQESLPKLHDRAKALRELDPSRLIILEDPEQQDSGLRHYCRPYRSQLEIMDCPEFYQAAPVSQEAERYLRQMGSSSRLTFMNGFGYPAELERIRRLADPNSPERQAQEKIFLERNLDRVFEGFNDYLRGLMQLEFDAIRNHLDALRNNPNLAGYSYRSCYWKSASEQDKVPALYQSLQELQAMVRPIIHIATTNLKPREEVPLTIYLVNEKRLEGRAELSLQLVGPTNQVLWKKRRSVKLPKPGRALWSGSVAASGSTGTHRFVVRLMQENRQIARNHLELYVLKPAQPRPEPNKQLRVHLLDQNEQWSERCKAVFTLDNLLAPIHIIPPLANSILAYPDNELMQILAQVHGGAIALFFTPPDDWNTLARQLDPEMELSATSRPLYNDTHLVGHYAKLHPIFEGLPARGFLRKPYRNVLPEYSFVETGEEDISGHLALERPGESAEDPTTWWGNNILVRRYGSGRIVFIHMPLLEKRAEDPVADRMLTNIVQHFERRSVPTNTPLPMVQSAVEWLRLMRTQKLRRWMVIGAFPNWEQQGHDTIYPPEEEMEFNAEYPGWDRVVQWRNWYTHSDEDHLLDFQDALGSFSQQRPMHDYATAYAYAEFSCDRRVEVEATLGVQNATKIWVNGRPTHAWERHVPTGNLGMDIFTTYLRQGRNTMLVKCSKIPGPFRFSVHFEPMDAAPLLLNWWK